MHLPEKLIRNLQNNNIVLFIGSGLSQSVGFENWKDLVIEILNNISDEEEKSQGYITALNSNLFEPVEILGKIESHKNSIINALEDIFKKHSQTLPSRVHEKLSLLSSKIVTTNYDDLIEKATHGFEKIVYHYDYKVSKISDYPKFVFKIHGDISEPDKCILFPSQYDSLYSKDEVTSIFELKKIISDKSLLFIGFSLTDPYINKIFEFITKLYKGFTKEHYLITTENIATWPKNITPIFIKNYNELENVVDTLITEKNKEVITTISDYSLPKGGNQAIFERKDIDYDNPPDVKYWVGRKMELENISNENFKVVCITGIGGQGKSALASQYLKDIFDPEIYEFGDWRDFKEETNRFQSKIISIIKRLEDVSDHKQFENIDNQELVDLFFHHLGNRKIVFVFDNVDSYIDLEKFIPKAGIGSLFSQALTRNHKSKFIFTCRPFIREASVNFYQISLSGLTLIETIELFEKYNLPFKQGDVKVLSEKVHVLTKGHPLWINLIAAQAIRGKNAVENFIEGLEKGTNFDEDNFSSILSHKILDKVWVSLNDKQKGLLRGIAETVKPESIDDLQKILKSEFNHNQFVKAIKNLKNLHLIEQKSSAYGVEQIELHPLVKDYILTKFPRSERLKYITFLVNFYDSYIYILKPRLKSQLTFESYLNWTSKIELQINKADYKTALIVLNEISDAILSANYVEEYLRVAEKLFDTIDWKNAIDAEYPYFHVEFQTLINTLSHFGKFEMADEYLIKYSKLIPGKSSHYITYCSLKCYLLWCKDDFKDAITIGEEGEFLLSNSGLTDSFMLLHNLALVRRESKDPIQIRKALDYFLMNGDINDYLNADISNLEYQGHLFGNIGRCLEYLNENESALKLYCMSFKLLNQESAHNTRLNKGFACQWISEVLLKQSDGLNSLIFLRYGMILWELYTVKSHKITQIFDKIDFDIQTKNEILDKPDWEIEKLSLKFINKNT